MHMFEGHFTSKNPREHVPLFQKSGKEPTTCLQLTEVPPDRVLEGWGGLGEGINLKNFHHCTKQRKSRIFGAK